METTNLDFRLRKMYNTLLLFIFVLSPSLSAAFQETPEKFSIYKGVVVNNESSDPIASALISVNRSNISTISNSDGEFSLRVPDILLPVTVTVSMLGYESKSLPLSYFQENNRIGLVNSVEELSEVNIFNAEDPRELVNKMLQKKDENYFSDETLMTSFYRETIKRRRSNVSLSEAVVKIYKSPHNSKKEDLVSIYKARKSTNYDKLDTLALKLRGGPFNALYLDLIKYTEYVLQPGMTADYEFSFDEPTKIDDHYIYVVNFEEKNKSKPWYFGQLYIDAHSLTLVRAEYNLNVDDRQAATKMFVKKKPSGSKVYPVDLSYQVDYVKNEEGKWHYSYGKAVMEYVVNWKRKIFNSRYTVNSEMVVTDWEKYVDNGDQKNIRFIDPFVVMSDDDSGFYDAEFWGDNNIIEPEKSIQNAIEKIKKNMENN